MTFLQKNGLYQRLFIYKDRQMYLGGGKKNWLKVMIQSVWAESRAGISLENVVVPARLYAHTDWIN